MSPKATADAIAQNTVLLLIARGAMVLSLPVTGYLAVTTATILADHNNRLTKLEQRLDDGGPRRDAQIAAINEQYIGLVQALAKQADSTNAKFDVIIDKMTAISNDVAGLNATARQK